MDIKLTKQFQKKLEFLLESFNYKIRFEKGNFKSGYCLIKDKKVVIINKYFTTEGKINALIEIIESINLDPKDCSIDNIKTLNLILKN
tara:strand:- start:374 stop:637 length:264 start_codon:yes stop_codon:yes gene_type:complete